MIILCCFLILTRILRQNEHIFLKQANTMLMKKNKNLEKVNFHGKLNNMQVW